MTRNSEKHKLIQSGGKQIISCLGTGWAEAGQEGGMDYKGALLGIMDLFIILILWRWFHGCIQMSELIKLWPLHMCS